MKVICMTCDAYEWQWRSFLTYWHQYNRGNDQLIMITEAKQAPQTTIQTGVIDWSSRLLFALEKIDSELIFFIQEDIWLKKDIIIEDYLNLFNLYGLKCLHIGKKSKNIKTNKGIYCPETQYLMNHKPAIWNVEYLKKHLKAGEDPWEAELGGTERIRKEYAGEIGFIEYDFYNDVCRKGKLIDEYKNLLL